MNKNNNDFQILQALINKTPPSREGFIGLITILIYSKVIFVKNEDAAAFVKNVFGITFLDYVIKSRTLLCARISRNLVNMSNKDIKDSIHKISLYLKTKEFIIHHNESSNLFNENNFKNKRNANRDVSTWINALLGKDKK